MEFFRQRPEALADQLTILNQEGPFTGLCLKHRSLHTDKVAYIQLLKDLIVLLADLVFADVGLKLPGPVAETYKSGFSEPVDGHYPTGDAKNRGLPVDIDLTFFDGGLNIPNRMGHLIVIRKEFDALP